MIDKTCPWCHKAFKAHHSFNRFCGRACAVRGRPGRSRRANSDVLCASCGKRFHKNPKSAALPVRHYCSMVCKSLGDRVRVTGASNPNYRGVGDRKCEGCGATYRSYSTARRFCGVDCSQRLSKNEYLTNVRKAIAAEKRCTKDLKAKGYDVCRSSGSRGRYDVVAVCADHILLISVKCTKARTRRHKAKDVAVLAAGECPAIGVRKQLWTWLDGDGWHIKEVASVANTAHLAAIA